MQYQVHQGIQGYPFARQLSLRNEPLTVLERVDQVNQAAQYVYPYVAVDPQQAPPPEVNTVHQLALRFREVSEAMDQTRTERAENAERKQEDAKSNLMTWEKRIALIANLTAATTKAIPFFLGDDSCKLSVKDDVFLALSAAGDLGAVGSNHFVRADEKQKQKNFKYAQKTVKAIDCNAARKQIQDVARSLLAFLHTPGLINQDQLSQRVNVAEGILLGHQDKPSSNAIGLAIGHLATALTTFEPTQQGNVSQDGRDYLNGFVVQDLSNAIDQAQMKIRQVNAALQQLSLANLQPGPVQHAAAHQEHAGPTHGLLESAGLTHQADPDRQQVDHIKVGADRGLSNADDELNSILAIIKHNCPLASNLASLATVLIPLFSDLGSLCTSQIVWLAVSAGSVGVATIARIWVKRRRKARKQEIRQIWKSVHQVNVDASRLQTLKAARTALRTLFTDHEAYTLDNIRRSQLPAVKHFIEDGPDKACSNLLSLRFGRFMAAATRAEDIEQLRDHQATKELLDQIVRVSNELTGRYRADLAPIAYQAPALVVVQQ